MRRTLITLLVVFTGTTPLLVAVAGQPTSRTSRQSITLAAGNKCTESGGPQADTLVGTRRSDVLCARPGNDYLHGAAANDILRSGKGKDTAVGGAGKDILRGGRGADHLFSVDGRGGETLVGGRGEHDQCFGDPGDHFFGCEDEFVGLSLQLVRSLERLAYQVMVVANENPAVTVTETITIGATTVGPPTTVTETITITETAVFPPCTPPPVVPPAPCP